MQTTQPKTHVRSGSDGPDIKPFTHTRSASSGSSVGVPSPAPPTVIPTAQQSQQQHGQVQNQQGTSILLTDVKVKVEPGSSDSPTQFANVTPPLLQQTNGAIQGISTNTGTTNKVEPSVPHVSFSVPNANNTENFKTGINPSTLPFTSYATSQNPSLIPQGTQVHVTPPPPGFAPLPPNVAQPVLAALPSYDEALHAKMASMIKQPLLPAFTNTSSSGEPGIPQAKNLNFANVIGTVPDNRTKDTGIHRNTGSFSDEAQDSPPVPKAPASSPQVATSIIVGRRPRLVQYLYYMSLYQCQSVATCKKRSQYQMSTILESMFATM